MQSLAALEDVSTLVVHQESVGAWRDAISRYGSAEFVASGMQVVGARTAMEAIEYAITGRGPQGRVIALPPLSRMRRRARQV